MNTDLLRTKMFELIKLDPEGSYNYQNEPLKEEEITAFEIEHKIKFPADYRAFIGHLYDGGFGPSPIMPLELWDSIHYSFHTSMENVLYKPFLTGKELLEHNKKFNDKYHPLNGTIRLSHVDGGTFLFLVVNGKEYGNIWIHEMTKTGKSRPLKTKTKRRISFEDWFTTWIDEKINESIENLANDKKREMRKSL